MPYKSLKGDPIVRITVTGHMTHQAVRVTVSDGAEDNLEINTRNLLYGADANEGSVSSFHTVDEQFIGHLKELCADPIFAGDKEDELPSSVIVEDGNYLEIKLYGADVILRYDNLWALEGHLESAPRAALVYSISAEVLGKASEVSGKDYSLRSMS